MSSFNHFFNVSSNLTHSPVRAVYIPTPNGLKLARISQFSSPKFKTNTGWECVKQEVSQILSSGNVSEEDLSYIPESYLEGILPDLTKVNTSLAFKNINIIRAQRRARVKALDLILCNPDMDLFATFTYAQDKSVDRLDYHSCYNALKPWLSNRVSRRHLKYVAVPEKHKNGGIHFHMICNKNGLNLADAHSPYTGLPLKHGGKQLYNVSDWNYGFTSAEDISGEDAHTKVAKYIFKYMTKNKQKIGGRYLLHGGKMIQPVYAYGDRPEEFMTDNPLFHKSVEIGDNISFKEWSFI